MDELENIKILIHEVASEVDAIANRYKKPSDIPQAERRILVRSIFAFFEAIAFVLKSSALMTNSAILKPEEIALAKEEDYELSDNGEVEIRKAKLRFKPNLLFAFKIAAKCNQINFKLSVNCHQWEALLRSIKVRDRLMHPKKSEDMTVTEKEIEAAQIAYEWIFDQFGLLAMMSLSKILKEKNK
jgi:hypothetical protein